MKTARIQGDTPARKASSMAKALIGYMHSDPRTPARLVSENARLRARVSELEALTLRLAQENDALRGRIGRRGARGRERSPTRVTWRTPASLYRGMRALPSLAAATLLLPSLGATAPAFAHGDNDRNVEIRAQLQAPRCRHSGPERERRHPGRQPRHRGDLRVLHQECTDLRGERPRPADRLRRLRARRAGPDGHDPQRGLRERGDDLRREAHGEEEQGQDPPVRPDRRRPAQRRRRPERGEPHQ